MINEKEYYAPKGGFDKEDIEKILKKSKDLAVQLNNGEEYYIATFMHDKGKLDSEYANSKNIFLVDKDGDEKEVKYSDISVIMESLNEAKEITKNIKDVEDGDVVVLGRNKHFKVDYIDPWSAGGRILVGKDVKTGKKAKLKIKFLTARGTTGLSDDTMVTVLESINEARKQKVSIERLSLGNTYKDSKGYPVKVVNISGQGNTWKITIKDDHGKEKILRGTLDKGVNLYEDVNEARINIKRKYGQRGSIKTIQKAPLRNSILNKIGNKVVTEEDMKNLLSKVEEDLGKPYNQTKWFRNNKRYFDKIKTSEGWSYKLSKYGKKVYDSIQNGNKKMITEMKKIPTFSNFLIESEITSIFEGRSEVQQAIKHIMAGAGWASTEYLEQFGGPSGLNSKDLTELAVELAKKGLLFKEEDLSDNHVMDGDNPADDDIDSVSVADAKKMKF